ncbi:MAG TPA: PAS domain S-box protein, partial [Phototrophicaceae bacterium]|nr:PAS domain S-box protein [Phototrophicaceae bacterium]
MRTRFKPTRPVTIPLTSRRLLSWLAVGGYLLALPLLVSHFERNITLLALVPIVLLAEAFGFWGGLAAGVAVTGFHLFGLPRLLDLGPAPFPGPYFWSAHAFFITVGVLVGFMAEGQRRLKKRLRQYEDAQTRLHDSQAMLQLIMDHIPQAVFWKDTHSNYLGANQRFLADTGLTSLEALRGKSDFDLPWSAQAEMYRADDIWVREQKQPRLNYEERQTAPDGSLIWVRTSKVPLQTAAGEVLAVLGIYEDITAQKQAAESLQVREAELAAIYEDTPLLMLLLNEERRIVRVNRAVTELTGQSADDLVGKFNGVIWGCVNALDNPENCGSSANCTACRVRQTILDTLTTGQRHYQVEATIQQSEMPDITVLVSTALLNLPQEKRVLVCLEDITERRQMETALRQSQGNLQTLFDTLDDFLLILDLTGRIIEVNPVLTRRLGYTAAELRQMTVLDIHSPKQQAAVAAWMLDLLAGRANRCSVSLYTHSGDLIPVETQAIQGRWNNQPVFFSISRDITERQQAADRLRENEAKLRSIIENARDGIRLLDENGVVIEWNAANEQVVGIPPAAALGKYYWDVIPAYIPDREAAVEKLRQQIQPMLHSGQIPPELTAIEYATRLPTGETQAILNTLFTVKTAQGHMLGGIVHDITVLKKTEQQRVQLAIEQQRVQTLQQFIGAATHDLMTPISIINTSTYLARKTTDPNKYNTYLDQVEAQSRRLQQILQDMMALSAL